MLHRSIQLLCIRYKYIFQTLRFNLLIPYKAEHLVAIFFKSMLNAADL